MIGLTLFFIVLGVLVKYGKMYFLLAGYNTMSKEEKDKYNVEGIASVFRNGMFGMATILIIGQLIAIWTENLHINKYTIWTALLIGIPYLLFKANSKKFKLEK